tara:strand:+ start:2557 stop:2709 length:153 start_codon:yes stop_codon:yes gene_type:complete
LDKNFLKKLYVNFWVPIFGRLVSLIIPIIEGKKPAIKPTYDLREKSDLGD